MYTGCFSSGYVKCTQRLVLQESKMSLLNFNSRKKRTIKCSLQFLLPATVGR